MKCDVRTCERPSLRDLRYCKRCHQGDWIDNRCAVRGCPLTRRLPLAFCEAHRPLAEVRYCRGSECECEALQGKDWCDAHWREVERTICLSRNGRWGTCGDCPRDEDGFPQPESCVNTARYDHWLQPLIYRCAARGCEKEAAAGSRYCGLDHLWRGRCAVRNCSEDIDRRHSELSCFCIPHGTQHNRGGQDLLEFMALLASAPPTAPAPVPGLGNAITTHGLPAAEDPAPVEMALVGAGVPSERAPDVDPNDDEDDGDEPCTDPAENLNHYCLATMVTGESCWNLRLTGEPFCGFHLREGRELLARERAELAETVEHLTPRIHALMAEAERRLVHGRLTPAQRACLPPLGPNPRPGVQHG